MIVWAKVAGILATVILIFGGGYWVGHTRGVAAVDALRAEQAQAATKALQTERAATAAQTAKLEQVQNAYDAIKDVPDPIAVHVSRLLIAKTADCPAVSGAAAVAQGTHDAAQVASRPPDLAASLGGYIAACEGDAKQLSAVIALGPR